MKTGTTIGYILDQLSVDINAYLCQEKQILSQFAEKLGQTALAEEFSLQAKSLIKMVSRSFFTIMSPVFSMTLATPSDKNAYLLTQRGRGPEGWIPLFAGLATAEQAESVRNTVMKEAEFNSSVPLGSAALSNPAYQPDTYWRGRVWLDQLYFGLVALRNYGYDDDARSAGGKTSEER